MAPHQLPVIKARASSGQVAMERSIPPAGSSSFNNSMTTQWSTGSQGTYANLHAGSVPTTRKGKNDEADAAHSAKWAPVRAPRAPDTEQHQPPHHRARPGRMWPPAVTEAQGGAGSASRASALRGGEPAATLRAAAHDRAVLRAADSMLRDAARTDSIGEAPGLEGIRLDDTARAGQQRRVTPLQGGSHRSLVPQGSTGARQASRTAGDAMPSSEPRLADGAARSHGRPPAGDRTVRSRPREGGPPSRPDAGALEVGPTSRAVDLADGSHANAVHRHRHHRNGQALPGVLAPMPPRQPPPPLPAKAHDAPAADASVRLTERQQKISDRMKQQQARVTERFERSGAAEELAALGGSGSGTFPTTPAGALKRCSDHLTDYEQSEVLDFPQIYFTGKGARKIKGTPRNPDLNFGYDDDRGDYLITLGDHVAYRYEILGILGKGSFGRVVKALDHKTGTEVALKVIRNKKRFHQQALIEVKILEHLRHMDEGGRNHVIHLDSYMYFRNHLCISFELLSINLYELLKKNHFRGFPESLICRFSQQILRALSFLRQLNIVHCDLKPENILLRHAQRSGVKVIDFGSSCFEQERSFTYIQSRFYRSPEVILGVSYSTPIDMWSLGCIVAELRTGSPIFPGENEHDQILCIMEVLGLPPASLVDRGSRRRHFFDSARQPRIVPNSRGRVRQPGNKSLKGVLGGSDAGFIDFVRRCLTWDPEERLTPDEALNHPWILQDRAPRQAVAAHGSSGVIARSLSQEAQRTAPLPPLSGGHH